MDSTLSVLYFPMALVLGALHALEPGHAKTLTAAYLIGIKGTKRDALLLGVSVAATHSIVVILLAGAALYVGREAFADEAMYWLQIVSGGVVVALGAWMLWRRLRRRPVAAHHHHHAPEPVAIEGRIVQGTVSIVNTPDGERMELLLDAFLPGSQYEVHIQRPGSMLEVLAFAEVEGEAGCFRSLTVPAEPHEFDAELHVRFEAQHDVVSFSMEEPDHDHDHGHDHDHSLMSDDEHARAHAATLPSYVKTGERPEFYQILAFGAAGGMIPCPASVSVMLLALSVGKTGMGMLTVLGFSLGLAITLVSVGMAVVMSLRAIGSNRHFEWLSRSAPAISAGVVMLSGAFALLVTLLHPHH